MRQDVKRAYENLIAHLRKTRRQWRWLIFLEGGLRCAGILALATTGALIFLAFSLRVWQFPFSHWIRIGTVLLLIGSAVYTVVWTLVLPLRRKLTDAAVAARLESTHIENESASENRILSAVQLQKALTDNRFGYAPEFIEHLIVQTNSDIEQMKDSPIFQSELSRVRRSAGIAVTGVGLLFITHFFLPTTFVEFTQLFQALPATLQVGYDDLEKSIRITEIQPGNIRIKRGTDVGITAKVNGHLGAPVELYYRIGEADKVTTTANWQSLLMQELPIDVGLNLQVLETSLDYQVTLEKVSRPIQYYISVNGVVSNRYQLTISNEPIVTQFQYRLNYPAYTQLQPQTIAANIGDIQTLFGTEVVFIGESNKPIEKASLVFDDSGDVPLEIKASVEQQSSILPQKKERIQGSFIAQKSDSYHIRITDTHGFMNRDPITHTLTVFEDAVPMVSIVAPARDSVLDNTMLVELEVEAMDDYGIQELQLVHRIEIEGAQEVKVPLKRWNVEETAIRRAVFLTHTWDVDQIGIFPGDTLSYYIQALDNDNVSGPNVGKSHTYTLRFPSLSEMYDSVAADQEAEQRGLDELFDEQADATGLVDNLLDSMKRMRRKNQELTRNDENLMQQVFEHQQQIQQTAKQLIDNMKQTAEEMEQNQLFDTETIKKYQELQNLMEKALTEEHKEILQKLSEALAKQQMTERQEAMTEANLSQEQFLQQLERAKSLYEQILLEQELEAAAKQAAALAEQQQELVDTLEASTEPVRFNDLAEKEDKIGKAFGQLSERLEKLGTEMRELAESGENAPPQIERLADEILRLNEFAHEYKLSEALTDTSTNLRKEQSREALESGRAAEQTLTELAQGLDNALAFMEGANANESLTVMREAVESGLLLSHLHEKVITQTNDILVAGQMKAYIQSEILKLQKLAADELTTAEGISRLSSKLRELGGRQIQVPPEVVLHLNASNDALERAARALEDRQPSLALPIQRMALADLNQAIFELLEAMAQMNQQMGADGLENMMQQLQQLAEGQEQLNQMAERLSQQMRDQGQTPGLQQMMQQLAAQQQLIREATERLAERAEQMSQMLGSLEEIAEEMREVENTLQQGSLDEQVLDRQAQILTRMLDSLRSLQKRDVGKQRKAEVAKTPSGSTQEAHPLHPELLELVRKLETTPNAKEFEDIPFQYREQLRQYFKALSQKRQ